MPKIAKAKIAEFEDVYPQLEVMMETMQVLAKSKPNDLVNLFKLKYVNNIVQRANGVLGKKWKPFPEFDEFDVEADLPSTSDVVMMLKQYLSRMEKFRRMHSYTTYDDDLTDIPTGSEWNASG